MATCCTWRDAVRPYTTTLVFQVPPGQRITIRRAQQHNALVKLAAHHCKGLQGVSFSQYHCLDDASLLALLTRHCVQVGECGECGGGWVVNNGVHLYWTLISTPSLHTQHLHMPSCTSITDVSIINAGAALRHVRHLTLSNCTRLTDASMQTIATHCQHLQALSICGCSNLTDAGLVAIGKGCSSLQRINLGWCEAVGDAGLTAFAAAVGPRLVDIDLCGCFRITDLGVVWLVWHCPNVVRLDLHCCRRITNASLAAIAEQLHALHFLNLSGCRKISPETVQVQCIGVVVVPPTLLLLLFLPKHPENPHYC